MTAPHLSREWLDERVERGRALPERTGATARLQHTVTKTPDGDVTYVEVYEDGRLVEATIGGSDDADIAFTVTHADSQAMARGELTIEVGFMQGRVKAAGDVGRFMAVLPAIQLLGY